MSFVSNSFSFYLASAFSIVPDQDSRYSFRYTPSRFNSMFRWRCLLNILADYERGD
jgi:hypothetical protein